MSLLNEEELEYCKKFGMTEEQYIAWAGGQPPHTSPTFTNPKEEEKDDDR